MNEYLDWKVGDRVECFNWNVLHPECYLRGEILPVVGKIYTIRLITVDIFFQNVVVKLNEIVNEKIQYSHGFGECAFFAEAFRKIIERPTDISIFEKMLTKTPEQNNKELVESELEELVNV